MTAGDAPMTHLVHGQMTHRLAAAVRAAGTEEIRVLGLDQQVGQALAEWPSEALFTPPDAPHQALAAARIAQVLQVVDDALAQRLILRAGRHGALWIAPLEVDPNVAPHLFRISQRVRPIHAGEEGLFAQRDAQPVRPPMTQAGERAEGDAAIKRALTPIHQFGSQPFEPAAQRTATARCAQRQQPLLSQPQVEMNLRVLQPTFAVVGNNQHMDIGR